MRVSNATPEAMEDTIERLTSDLARLKAENERVRAVSISLADAIEREARRRLQPARGGQHVPNTGDFCSTNVGTMVRLEWWARAIRAALTAKEQDDGKA